MATHVRRLSYALMLVSLLASPVLAQKIDFVALPFPEPVGDPIPNLDITGILALHATSTDYVAGDVAGGNSASVVQGILPPAPLLCPTSANVVPGSFNKARTIVGTCGRNGTLEGFLRTAQGAFTFLRHPKGTETHAMGGNDTDLVVGFYRDSATGQFKALHWQKGVYSTFVPRVPHILVVLSSVNNKGHIVGIYDDDAGVRHGFVFQKGRTPTPFVLLEVPGALEVYPLDVNDQGQVLGAYVTPEFVWIPFLWQEGQFSTTTVPGARFFSLSSLTNDGRVAGSANILTEDGVTSRQVGLIAQGLTWTPLTPTLATVMTRSATRTMALQAATAEAVETTTGAPLCQAGVGLSGKLRVLATVVCGK